MTAGSSNASGGLSSLRRMKLRQVDVLTSQGQSVTDAVRSIDAGWGREWGLQQAQYARPARIERSTPRSLTLRGLAPVSWRGEGLGSRYLM